MKTALPIAFTLLQDVRFLMRLARRPKVRIIGGFFLTMLAFVGAWFLTAAFLALAPHDFQPDWR